MKELNELKALVNSFDDDAVKFYEKGNKAAGTRVRKALQSVRVLAQQMRVDVSNTKNA